LAGALLADALDPALDLVAAPRGAAPFLLNAAAGVLPLFDRCGAVALGAASAEPACVACFLLRLRCVLPQRGDFGTVALGLLGERSRASVRASCAAAWACSAACSSSCSSAACCSRSRANWPAVSSPRRVDSPSGLAGSSFSFSASVRYNEHFEVNPTDLASVRVVATHNHPRSYRARV